MSIALAGAHRVGKSTLAQAFAEKHGCLFVPSPMRQAFDDIGVPVGQLGLTFDVRMRIQERALDLHLKATQEAAATQWISDRSTLDMATYTMLDAAADPTYDHDRVAAYVERCIQAANKSYVMVVLVQPGIPYVIEDGKPPPNASQQELFNYAVFGLLQDPRLNCGRYFLQRGNLGLESRLESIGALVDNVMTIVMQQAQQAVVH